MDYQEACVSFVSCLLESKFDGPTGPVMIRPTLCIVVSRYDLILHENKLISPLSFKIRRHVLDRCKIYCMNSYGQTSPPPFCGAFTKNQMVHYYDWRLNGNPLMETQFWHCTEKGIFITRESTHPGWERPWRACAQFCQSWRRQAYHP